MIRKKILSLVLCLLMVTVVFAAVPANVSAEEGEIILPPGFGARVIYSGPPFAHISGLAVSEDEKLYVVDFGDWPVTYRQKLIEIDLPTMTATVLLSGPPFRHPIRMLVGDGRPLLGNDIIIADQNGLNPPNGAVFKIDRETSDITVLSNGSPIVPIGDPREVALGPGGDFGTALYVMDNQGASAYPPLLFKIESDGSRSVFLQNPQIWTTASSLFSIAFGEGDFSNYLFVAEASFRTEPPPTIYRVTPQGEISSFVEGAPLMHPTSIRFGPGGPFGTDLFVLDNSIEIGSGRIFRISTDGTTSLFCSGLPIDDSIVKSLPDFVFAPDGNSLYVSYNDKIIEIFSMNQPPTITQITGPIDPIKVGDPVNMIGTFTDPDTVDTHSAIWDWGDNNDDPGMVTDGTVTGTHPYSTPGVYTITLTVEDAAGESDTETYEQYVVVFDPTGAFITGGGLINSPLGALPGDPELTGKASFGFVSKYQKGATVPTGNTQFRFHAGDISFKSAEYEWLVVAGAKGMFKGTGTINGEGNYGFLLSAIDSDLPGGGDVDRFRIKIWNKNTDELVYDNNFGSAENADPTTALMHGSIKIHKA